MNATTETTEAPTLLEKKTHDPARYGERWAALLDARWDQVRYRQLRAVFGFRNPNTPGAVQARANYEKTLALYEEERAQALADSMSDVYELA
jgi:hypothetical protein